MTAAPFKNRTWFWAPVIVVIAGALALAAFPLIESMFRFEKNYSEGWNAYHAARAAGGETLYSGDPRRLVNYPFLSFYLVAWMKPLVPDVLEAGRLLNLAGLLATIVGGAVVARRLGARPIEALLGAACVLGYHAIQAPAWIGSNDPQLLAEALMVAGLAWYLTKGMRPSGLAITALLFALGGFTKPNLVAIPAAVAFDLWRTDRRSFGIWCGFAAMSLAMLGGLTYAIAGGDFLHELTAPRVWQDEPFAHTRKFLIHFKLPLLFAIIYLIGARGRERTLMTSYGAIAFASAMLLSAVDGTSYNIFLDVANFLGIAAALMLHQWREALGESSRMRRVAAVLLPLVVAQPVTGRLPSSLQSVLQAGSHFEVIRWHQERFAAAARLLKSTEGPALCESLFLCFEAGKPLVVDPYNARQMILVGRSSEAALVDEIVRHRYGIVVMPVPIYRDKAEQTIDTSYLYPQRFTEATLRAIARSYEEAARGDGFVFYRPRHDGIARD